MLVNVETIWLWSNLEMLIFWNGCCIYDRSTSPSLHWSHNSCSVKTGRDDDFIRYVLAFILLYFFSGFFIYYPPPVHVYIWAPGPQMNTSVIHNMVSSQNLGFFSPRCTVWLTIRSLFWSILSSIFIIARSCFNWRLFFITTPRHDSAAATAISDMHRCWLLWLRDAPPLPSYLQQPARRRLDWSHHRGSGSIR
jgi:hypothetical protein